MVKVWSSADGGEFTHECGAVYAVTRHRIPMKDRDSYTCDVCGEVMAEWNSTEFPTFELIKRP